MFRPLALYIGLRYTRAKRHNHFISFIAGTSMIGIALGVAVLITVLSVMNGFDEQIHQRVFSMAVQVSVSTPDNKLANWQGVAKKVAAAPGVVAVTPAVAGQGLMSNYGQNTAVYISGIVPSEEGKVTALPKLMVQGSLNNLKPGEFGVVLGQVLADRLGLAMGDKAQVMIPQGTVSPFGIHPQFKRFTVVGIFHAGRGFGFDNQMAFINLTDAQKLFLLGDDVSGLRVKVNDVFLAPMIADRLSQILPPDLIVGNWTEQFGAFFNAVKMEKNMMFLILLLIVAVAAFNLVSSLVMVVTDKQADIAILRTIGALPRTILGIFMVQGMVIGIIGTILGLLGGLLLAYNVTVIVDWLQRVLHLHLLSPSVYGTDFLPSKIEVKDVVTVCSLALFMSFLATIYPAWRAARTQPAEALRYD